MERKNILNSLPDQYRPLSPWAYFGYSILFSVPLVGFICLIVFSFNKKNINRRNFARSYFCAYILLAVLIVAMVVLCQPAIDSFREAVEAYGTI